MKHLALSLAIFLSAIAGLRAQSQEELSASLSRDMEAYKQYTLAQDFDNSLQFMPPKMFDIIPRDSLKANMIQAMDNEYLGIQMTGMEYDSLQKPSIKKAGDYHWAYVHYNGSMRMILKKESDFTAVLIPIIKGQYGEENVQVQGDSIIDLKFLNKKIIVFKDPASATWAMIEDKRNEKNKDANAAQKKLLKSVLPKPVLKAIEKK